MLCSVAVLSFSQHLQGSLTSSLSDVDRLSLVKTSIDLPSWHEKEFWPVYEDYMREITEASTSTYRSLQDLAAAGATPSDALNSAQNIFAFRTQEFALRKQYFQKIGSSFNGVIALQFLQTELLLDMVESSKIYDQSRWRKFRFYHASLPEDKVQEAKYNTMKKALAIPEANSADFWEIYKQYELECDELLGYNYDMLSQFAGDPADYTPALAKRLGYNMLNVVERELKLKEKYFKMMNEKVGPELASGFLVWEDYFSLVSKMHSWAEAN